MRDLLHKPLVRTVLRALMTVVVFTGVAGLAMAVRPPRAHADFTTANQHQIVPAYFYPDVWNDPNDWKRMCNSSMDNYGVASAVIANPNSGPGTAVNSDYTDAIAYCHNATVWKGVLGYVYTNYGQRPLADVEADVHTWYNLYSINGIFVDEMSNNATDNAVGLNNTTVTVEAYYHALYNYVRSVAPSGQANVMGNPGASATSDWQLDAAGGYRSADEVNIFEGNATTYSTWSPPSWVSNYPANDFSEVVYGAGSATNTTTLASVCSRSKNLNAGYIYVTYGSGTNPYNFFPTDSYWSTELSDC